MIKSDKLPTRSEYVAAARSFLGTPYRHQGRDMNGIDCLGLLVGAARLCHIPHRDNTNYGRTPDHVRMKNALLAHMNRITREEAIEADHLFIRWDRRAHPCHLAIITQFDREDGWPIIIHALGHGASKVVEQRMPRDWVLKVHMYLRWKQWRD